MDHLEQKALPPDSGSNAGGTRRSVTYCVVPAELAAKLHDPLRRHFRDDSAIEVIVEQRGRERRRNADRRVSEGKTPPAADRRKIRSATGRRMGERRAPVAAAAQAPELPRRFRRHADELTFLTRVEPTGEQSEDVDTARLVARFQAGDRDAFSILYARYYDRVYGYLRVALTNQHDAEDAAQQVFMSVLEKLGDYEMRGRPFRHWLFTSVRNAAISQLRKSGRVDLEDPQETGTRLEKASVSEVPPFVFGWIADRDLLVLVERLPLAQRQVLLLRFMLDLPAAEVGEILGRTPVEVRKLQHRAMVFLRERLAALGRTPRGERIRSPWRRRKAQVGVLRERRYALLR
jgi:RNA polymerase sigma-70 factor (ECF subfamily)